MTDVVIAHLRELINDQRHFSARWLRDLKTRTGADPETAAAISAAIYGICLLQADQAQFLANGGLIAVPLLLTYIYPLERPSTPLLLIYWACLSISTLFDKIFAEALPAYYVFKICAMSLLVLRPVCGAQKILEFIEKNKLPTGADTSSAVGTDPEPEPFNAEELRELEKAKNKKSPPPEKPEGEVKNPTMPPSLVKSAKPYSSVLKSDRTQATKTSASVRSKKHDVVTPAPTPVPTPPPVPEQAKQEDSSRQTKNVQSLYLPAPNEGGNASLSTPPKPSSSELKKQDSTRQSKQSLYLPAPSEGGVASLTTKVRTPTSKTPPPPSQDSSRQTKQSLYLPAPSEGGVASVANSPKPVAATPPKNPTSSLYLPAPGENASNPMFNDSNYRLTTSASNTSTDSIEGEKNLNDLIFAPTQKIIFNSPFDDRSLTYHMTVKNNCRKWIAYAIKSNAIPRVTANPPSGILKPGDKHVIAVNIQKFKIDDVDVSKDRIAYDYVFCPPDTKAFAHSLFQGNFTRRRKNIKIEYNP